MKCQLYLIIKDYLVVTEGFGADTSLSCQILLSLLGGNEARCPVKQGEKRPCTKPCGLIKGAFRPFVPLVSMPFPCRFFKTFSVDLKEPR